MLLGFLNMTGERLSLAERFAEKWMPEPNSGCWLWIGYARPDGYGIIDENRIGHRSARRAHRISYEIHKGQIPAGKLVLHSCDTPACVNPDHLFVGTHQTNVDDCIGKGRFRYLKPKRGEDHDRAKVTAADVLAIRQDKSRLVDIAERYGISVAQASNIRTGKQWKSV